MMSNYKPPTIAPPTFSFPNPQYLCFVFWTLVILNPTELNTPQGPVDCPCYLMEIFLHSSSKIFSPKLCGMLCLLIIIPLNNLPRYLVLKYHKVTFLQRPRAYLFSS